MQAVSVGTFIQASSLLNDTGFENAVIYIHQYNEDGAAGFVVNRVFDRCLNELAEYSDSKPITLYDGGPVNREHLFVLHRKPELIGGGMHITGETYFGGNFAEAVRLLNNGKLQQNDIRIFIGYCGWDNQQLEEEVEEGSWQIIDPASEASLIWFFNDNGS